MRRHRAEAAATATERAKLTPAEEARLSELLRQRDG
jgi:hypothetical protein